MLTPSKIDTIVNLALKKSTQASTKEVFKIQVEDLRTKSDACIKEAQLIQAEMTNWGDLISEVLYAVSDRECTCFVVHSSSSAYQDSNNYETGS